MVSTTATSAVCFALAFCLQGCGGEDVKGTDNNPRVNASGKVEFDGKPVAAGTVTFLQAETGNYAICEIYDGTYESEDGAGPNPGKNAVSIVAKETADGYPLWQQAWKKQVEVGTTDFTEDFAIKASEIKPLDPNSIKVDD